MAKKLNMSQSAYAKLENGITKLDIDRLVDIAKILEVDIQDLLNVENIKNNYYSNNEIKNSPGFVENFYVGIKEAYEETIKHLKEEIEFLKKLLEKRD